MKRVLIITDYIAPYEGNFIQSLKKLEKSIKKDGNDFFYLFPSKAKKITWIKSLNNTFFLDDEIKKRIFQLNKFIKAKKINIIYSHFCLPRTQLIVKMMALKNRNVRLYQHFHNHFALPNNIFKRTIFKYIYEGDVNIGCSADVANTLPYKNSTYATNAIDFARLEYYEPYNIAEKNQFIILMFGYTYYRKGVDLAIRAISKLNNKDIILAISVSKNVSEFKNNIKKDFGKIPSFVKILEPRNDIATYYKASNLFLSAAREEGFCYAIVESMYCGLPCVCTDLPGQPNDIPNLVKVPKENVDALSEKINLFINNKVDFNEEKTKKYIIQTYAIDNWVKNVKRILEL